MLITVLLPTEAPVFFLPGEQQIFDDGSLYGHLDAPGTSLKWGGGIARREAGAGRLCSGTTGTNVTGESLEMDGVECSFPSWHSLGLNKGTPPSCATHPCGLWQDATVRLQTRIQRVVCCSGVGTRSWGLSYDLDKCSDFKLLPSEVNFK